MLISYENDSPQIHPEAYVAPQAILRGNVHVGKGACILFGAVVTAEGGAVEIGADCVIMEQAVIRGTPKHPVCLGDSVLVGPHAHLSGCTIEEDVFIATGSSVFNGAQLHSGSEVRINGVVHVNTVLQSNAVVPIGWIALGNPAKIFSPGDHEAIWAEQKQLNFPRTVWGVDRSVPQGERIRAYAKALQHHHKKDEILPESVRSDD